MTIKYLKGSENKVADTLSRIETRLDPETVTELLNHAKGGAPRAKDIQIIKEEERADQEVILRTTQQAPKMEMEIPEMESILCTQPMELVHVDYVGMEVTVVAQEQPVVKNVLVIVDHFTRYIQAFVTNNHTAHTMARVLYNNFFSVFGFPQKLMSDQGPSSPET